ncbi:hypothetical protein BJV82DRAFT_145625 [Fennellomyces sp. T-0311]|nr:hypothetical protein BJV82DRAFT_145625 [Fennellomyces sp. T-0311]
MASSGSSRQAIQNTSRLPHSNSRQMSGISLNRCLTNDLRGLAEESREPTKKTKRWRNSQYRNYMKTKSRSLPLSRRLSTTVDPPKKVNNNSLTRSLSLLIRRLRPKSLRRNRRNVNETELCAITLIPQQLVQETSDSSSATFENDNHHPLNKVDQVPLVGDMTIPVLDSTDSRMQLAKSIKSVRVDYAQPSVSKRNSRSSMISKAASRSSITVSSIYNTFASGNEDDEDYISFIELTRSKSDVSLSSSKRFSCGRMCIEKDQHLETSSQNVDDTDADKQQVIANRDAPNERRASRSSLPSIQMSSSCPADIVQQPNHNESGTSSDDDEVAFEYVKLTAERLWNEDDGVCERERIAEWLGTNDHFRSSVLKQYMSNFDFGGERIDDSFRKLCGKMYFKAEAQQIDRILEVFASRYWECNPTSIMRSSDVVHAIVYSLLLLNTDLHGVYENHKKMTRAKFIRNTMATVCDLAIPGQPVDDINDSNKVSRRRGILPMSESVLSALSSASNASSRWIPRRSISSKSISSISTPSDVQLQQPAKNCKGNSISTTTPDNSHSSDNPTTVIAAHGSTNAQQSWQQDIEDLLRDLYSSVKAKQIIQTSQPKSSASDEPEISMDKKALLRRRRGQSLLSPLTRLYIGNDDHPFDQRRISHSPSSSFCANDSGDNGASVSERNIDTGIQARKEAVVMQKHVMERHNKKARHRTWQPCILKVHEGKADLCRPCHGMTKDQKRKSFAAILGNHHKYSHISDFQHYYQNHSNSPTEPMETIDLKHALANSLPPPGWHGERQHVFSLQTSDGAVWLFESHDLESTLEWVTCCNYWSALLSKESLPGAVCNLDFGWSPLHDTENSVECKLSCWIAPVPSFVASTLTETEKVETLERHIAFLQHEIKQHRTARECINKRFTGPKSSNNRSIALDNWENKMQYLLHEIIKYRTYRDTLKCSLPSHIDIP